MEHKASLRHEKTCKCAINTCGHVEWVRHNISHISCESESFICGFFVDLYYFIVEVQKRSYLKLKNLKYKICLHLRSLSHFKVDQICGHLSLFKWFLWIILIFFHVWSASGLYILWLLYKLENMIQNAPNGICNASC